MGRMGRFGFGRPGRSGLCRSRGGFGLCRFRGGSAGVDPGAAGRSGGSGRLGSLCSPAVRQPGYSISKVRAVSLSTVMRTVTTFSGSSDSIRSGHSTRQRSPE